MNYKFHVLRYDSFLPLKRKLSQAKFVHIGPYRPDERPITGEPYLAELTWQISPYKPREHSVKKIKEYPVALTVKGKKKKKKKLI